MELGRGPVFTFPLAEEAQDERAAERAQTHTVHVHVRLTDMPGFFFAETRAESWNVPPPPLFLKTSWIFSANQSPGR